jgi:SAM-dependent methyltransferase
MSQLHDSVRKCDAKIFVVSTLTLYLELLLIRWIGTEARIFAYLGNLILIACFFGTGLGCLLASRPATLTRVGLNLLLLTVLVANPFRWERLELARLTNWLAGLDDLPLWAGAFKSTGTAIIAAMIMLGVILYLVVFAFVPIGQILGHAFSEHPRVIRAYSINVAGSLVGILLFNLLSWLCTPPLVWFMAAAVLLAALTLTMMSRNWWFALALVPAIASVYGTHTSEQRTVWSPYQKLTVTPSHYGGATNQVLIGYEIEANGLGYQGVVNLSEEFLKSNPGLFNISEAQLSHYNLAFEINRDVHRLLVVGAGSGNNAAAALRHGVEQIDCVEIDPQIYALGKELHPEHPYDSPRVHMYLTDARAFLKQARGSYDLIWFGLLDTHPGSSYNNRRVDHYVYTLQCLQEARQLLAPKGILLMNFAARRPWISDRLYGMFTRVFGHEPLAFQADRGQPQYGAGGELTLIGGNEAFTIDDLPAGWLRDYVKARQISLSGTTRPTTDDWPYLYIERAKIPKLYVLTSLTILGAIGLAGWRGFGVGRFTFDWHFFALGAAFLLLEVQTVSRATLLFGMTWEVNAIVISAILVMILLANLVAWRWPGIPQWTMISGLALALAALGLVPLSCFNQFAGASKLIAASSFLTAPVFFAGVIFIQSFAASKDKARALGSNLMGALIGGLLESLSFITGIRALIVLVGLFYLVAVLTRTNRTPLIALQPE